jgi:hypothetical protein
MTPHIKLFITASYKIRAIIKEPGLKQYEVTIGGEMWRKGKGRRFEGQILIMVEKMVNNITKELRKLQ